MRRPARAVVAPDSSLNAGMPEAEVLGIDEDCAAHGAVQPIPFRAQFQLHGFAKGEFRGIDWPDVAALRLSQGSWPRALWHKGPTARPTTGIKAACMTEFSAKADRRNHECSHPSDRVQSSCWRCTTLATRGGCRLWMG